MTKSRTNTSRPQNRSVIRRSATSVRTTSEGEDSSSAAEGTERYEVEDHQARRGSRASSVESEETDGASAMGDSTDIS